MCRPTFENSPLHSTPSPYLFDPTEERREIAAVICSEAISFLKEYRFHIQDAAYHISAARELIGGKGRVSEKRRKTAMALLCETESIIADIKRELAPSLHNLEQRLGNYL